MRVFGIFCVLLAATFFGALNRPVPAAAGQTGSANLTKESLKSFLENMGFELKDLGDNVYEISMKRADDTIYVGISLSGSLSKIWLTANYGMLTDHEKSNSTFLLSLAEKNAEIQPTHFYVRKGRLSIGRPIDNRNMTASLLRKEIDTFVEDMVKTKDFWNRKP